MTFTLYPHQADHNKRAAIAIRDKEHVIIQSPGGTGKTKMFVSIAWSASAKGRTVLILTDRKNIYKQNIAEAGAIGINPDTPLNIQIRTATVYVAMAQTLISRIKLLEQFNNLPQRVLVLVDECHTAIFNKILDTLHNRITGGFTATPHYKWAKHLPIYYNDIVQGEQIDWFIQNGWLCSYQHIARGKKEMEQYLVKNAAGEYTEKSQDNWFSQGGIYDGLIDDLKSEQGKYTKGMIFCASINNAHDTYEKLKEAGFKVCIGHSKSNLLKEIGTAEEAEVKKFKDLNSGYDLMVSVSSYTTGFDMPEVNILFFYRAFGSLILYMQSLFRGNRKKPPHMPMMFKVYDYGDNWRRHGLYYEDRYWDKLWNKAEDKKQNDALGTYSVKECDNCGSIISLMARVCEWCKSEQPVNEQELKQGELINITAEYEKLIGLRLSQLNPQQLSTYAKVKQKLQFAIRIAKSNRQKQIENNESDNFLKSFGHAMGYSDKWYNVQSNMLKKEPNRIFFTDLVLK